MVRSALHEKAAKLAEDIKALGAKYDNEKNQWPDSEMEGQWQKLNAEYDQTAKDIEAEKRQLVTADIAARLKTIDQGFEVQPLASYLEGGGTHPTFAPVGRITRTDRRRMEARAFLKDHGINSMAEATNVALGAWMKGDDNYTGPDIEEWEYAACVLTGINPHSKVLDFKLPVECGPNINRLYRKFAKTHPALRDPEDFMDVPIYGAALTTQTPASGGNIVPPETMLRRIEVNLLWFGGMREVSEIMITPGGEKITWPSANDTSNKGRYIPENTAADDNAGAGSSGDGGPNPTFAKTEWGAYKATSDTVLIPFELIQDNVLGEGLLMIIGDMLGERIGRATNEKYTVGSGTSEPGGIVTRSAAGVTGVAVAGPTWEQTIELEHSVDKAYRDGGAYMCHDSTILFLRKLKDQQGRPIWQNGIQDGVPDRLNGRRIVTNNDMAEIAASAKPMLFGRLSAYKIRRAGTLRLYRLEERYREKDQTGMVAFLREDGNLLNAGTPPVKHMVQAAT